MSRSKPIRVGAIDNTGPNTLVSYLRNAATATTQIDMAVAFVTAAGLASVLHLLKKTSSKGRVRFLTGLYQGFTEPKALRTLLREQRQAKGRLMVQLSVDPHFHWKTYFLVGRTTAHIVIGSSNLTDDGLRRTGEFNAVLSMRTTSAQFRELHSIFDRHWGAKSTPLTAEVLSKYEKWRSSVDIPIPNRHVPISTILNTNGRSPKADVTTDPCYWRTALNGYLSDETEAMLEETTDWDRRGYSYFSTGRPTFAIGDRIVLFDLELNNVQLVEIKDTAQSPIRTPDGYHFAAYRRLRGTCLRRLVPKRWKALKAATLLRRKDDVDMTRKLSSATFNRFVDSLTGPTK